MTPISALADCVTSGQVPDECVPSLIAATPGLREELECRSRATSPVLTGEAGRGVSVLPTQTAFRPADPFHFHRQLALTLGIQKQEARHRLKGLRFLPEFIRSLHPPSFLRKLMRK